MEKLFVSAHSSSQKEGVLQEDREAHRAKDKGVSVLFQSGWDAGQHSAVVLESPPDKVTGSSLPQEGGSRALETAA